MRLKSAPKDSFKYFVEHTSDLSKRLTDEVKYAQRLEARQAKGDKTVDFMFNYETMYTLLTSDGVGGFNEFVSYFLYMAVIDQYLSKGGNDFVLSTRLCEKMLLTNSEDVPYWKFKVSDAVNFINLDNADLYIEREIEEKNTRFTNLTAGIYNLKIRGVLIVDTDKMKRKPFVGLREYIQNNIIGDSIDQHNNPVGESRYVFVAMLEDAPEPYAQFASIGKSQAHLMNLRKIVTQMMVKGENGNSHRLSPIGIAFDLAVKAILYMNDNSSNIETNAIDFGSMQKVIPKNKRKKGPPKYKWDHSVVYVQERDKPKQEANWVASDELVDQVDEIMDIVNSEPRASFNVSPHFRRDHYKKRWVLKAYVELNDLQDMVIREETFEVERKNGTIEEVTKYLVPIKHTYKNIIGGNTERPTVYKTKRLKN